MRPGDFLNLLNTYLLIVFHALYRCSNLTYILLFTKELSYHTTLAKAGKRFAGLSATLNLA